MPIGRASYPEAVMSNVVLSTFLVLSIATTASAQKVTKE
jgi:hypothetical protein